MKALVLTQHPIYSKRTKMILDRLIEAGYDVEHKVFSEGSSLTGQAFDFVVVDEESIDKEEFKKFCKNPLDSL